MDGQNLLNTDFLKKIDVKEITPEGLTLYLINLQETIDLELRNFASSFDISPDKSIFFQSFTPAYATAEYQELTVMAHSDIIKEVLIELIRNAVHSILGRGVVEVTIQRKEQEVVALVSDTGIGISSENLDCVTQQGFTTKEGGTGQGLYLTKVYIEEVLGGKLEINSVEGVGTSVRVGLPYAVE